MCFCTCNHLVVAVLMAASGVIAFESDEKVVNGAASIEAEHSSLVPLDAEVLLEGPYYQCTWLHPAAMPAGGPQPLALAPPPPLVLQSGPVFEDSSQTETLPPPSQPQTTKNKTASIVRDGGVKETERSNVASSQDGARLLFANPESKKPESILSGDKFSFMKNDCADDKFVAIELSQRVKLTSLEVTMIELYSSRARTIDLYSTLTKPVKTAKSPWLSGDWAYFATVKAENKKGDHVFSLAAEGFTRYLLLHFTSHYGTETFCTINNVRVFGVTETEDLEAQLEALQDSSAEAAATAEANFVETAEDLDHLNDLSGLNYIGIEPYLDVAPDHLPLLSMGSEEADPEDTYDEISADEQEPQLVPNREVLAHGAADDDPDLSDRDQSAEHATHPNVAAHDSNSALEAEDPALSSDSLAASVERRGVVHTQNLQHQPSSEVPVSKPNAGELQKEAYVGDAHVSSDSDAAGDSESARTPSVNDASNIGVVNSGTSKDSEQVDDATVDAVASAGDSSAQAHDVSAPTQADAQPHHSSQGQHEPSHSTPHAVPHKTKAPVADRKSLLLSDGTVTGLYQTDVPPDVIPHQQPVTGAATTPTDVQSTPSGTVGSAAPTDSAAAAEQASHSDGGISSSGGGSAENSGTTRRSSQGSTSGNDESQGTSRTPDIPSGGSSQSVQPPPPSESSSSATTQEVRAPAAQTTNRTSGPSSPTGQATHQRPQPAAGAGHSSTNTNANGITNVNTTSTVSSSGASTAPGEGSSAATSKSGSVYDTIKKELLSLRVETSTLSKTVSSTASVANVTNLTKRHDAAIKRLTAVSNRVHELEVVLAGLQLASSEAALAQQRLQREVSLAIVLSVVAVALALLLWRSRQREADQGLHGIPWSRHSPSVVTTSARPSTGPGPVSFYSRSKSHADLMPQQVRVTPSHSSQSLPSTALHHSQVHSANAYTRAGSAPNSHPQNPPSLTQRTPSGTVLPVHASSVTPTQSGAKCTSRNFLPRTSEHDSEYHDGERSTEYHEPLQDHMASSVVQNGSSAPFPRHCGSSRDVYACSTAVWNSDSAFNSLTTVPANLKRSFGGSSIHSIRTNTGLTRRNRSRTSSEIPSPATASPTYASQAQSSAGAQGSQPVQIAHPHQPCTSNSVVGSAAQRRKASRSLARASAPATTCKAPLNAQAQSAKGSSASAANGSAESISGMGRGTGARRSGSIVSEQGSCNLGDSEELEDLLPAPTFAHLAHRSLLSSDGAPTSHHSAAVAAPPTSQPLPLSDSRAIFLSDDTAGDSGNIPECASNAAHSAQHGKQAMFEDSSCSLGSSPHSHRSWNASIPTSSELPSVSRELNGSNGTDAVAALGSAPLLHSTTPTSMPELPVALSGASDDIGAASGNISSSISPLQRRSGARSVTTWKSPTAARSGSLGNGQSVAQSEGSMMSDACGGSDAGSLRCSRTQSVHVLRSNPSIGSLPGHES